MRERKTVHVLGFAGYSGAGKTTLIEKLIPLLREKGNRIAVIKHDAHGLRFDEKGKDSQRFSAAGAVVSLVNGPEQSAVFLSEALSLEESVRLVATVCDADLVLIEGYKNNTFAQIGLMRKETGKGFTGPLDRFEALVTDDETVKAEIPVFSPDEAEKLADFIAGHMKAFETVPDFGQTEKKDS